MRRARRAAPRRRRVCRRNAPSLPHPPGFLPLLANAARDAAGGSQGGGGFQWASGVGSEQPLGCSLLDGRAVRCRQGGGCRCARRAAQGAHRDGGTGKSSKFLRYTRLSYTFPVWPIRHTRILPTHLFIGIYRYSVYTGVYWHTPVHTGIHRYTPVYTGVYTWHSPAFAFFRLPRFLEVTRIILVESYFLLVEILDVSTQVGCSICRHVEGSESESFLELFPCGLRTEDAETAPSCWRRREDQVWPPPPPPPPPPLSSSSLVFSHREH